MTPQEINDYKTRWLRETDNSVRIHSDLDVEGKDWCRRNVERHQWSFRAWTAIYEHTFYFEDRETKSQFEKEFEQWIVQ